MEIRTDEKCEFCKNVIEDLNHLLLIYPMP